MVRGMAEMNVRICRLMQAILDDAFSVQDEIDIGNAMARCGRALVRDGKQRLAEETRPPPNRAGLLVETGPDGWGDQLPWAFSQLPSLPSLSISGPADTKWPVVDVVAPVYVYISPASNG